MREEIRTWKWLKCQTFNLLFSRDFRRISLLNLMSAKKKCFVAHEENSSGETPEDQTFSCAVSRIMQILLHEKIFLGFLPGMRGF